MSVWRDPGHVGWVLGQQVVLRTCQALKFLIAARCLGPEAFALVAVAMTVLLVAEALSDTGLGPAMVQRAQPISPPEVGAVWTLQLFRGGVLALVLWGLSQPLADLFLLPAASDLIAFVALVPVFRGAGHPGYLLLQRDRAFRAVSGAECMGAILDLGVTMLALHVGLGPASLVWGSLAAEVWRLCAGVLLSRVSLQPNLGWRRVRALGQFGVWVWATSALAVLLNQFDKVVVARWLGGVEFGLYQTAARVAQLAVTDLPSAAAQHAFANISRAHHQAPQAAQGLFIRYLRWTAMGAGVVAVALALAAHPLLVGVLGPQWADAVPVLRAQCAAMWVGALMAMAVAHVRATGKPQWVVHAVLGQALVLVTLAWPAIHWAGAVGMALAAAAAGGAALAYLLWRSWPSPHA
jgi:O-antigen/teichoic acid export membrane protein